MRFFLLGLFLALGLMVAPASARPHPTPAPTATPTPPPEIPSITKIAVRQMVAWQAGTLERSAYTDAFNAQVDDAHVQKVAAELGQLGSYDSSTFVGLATVATAPPGVISYLYQMKCAKNTVFERLSLDPAGKIAGIVFVDKLSSLNPAPSPSPKPSDSP